MSQLQTPPTVKYFISCLYNHKSLELKQVRALIFQIIGETQVFEPSFNPLKEYYAKEMGDDLTRVIFYNESPQPRDELVPLKLQATRLEEEYASDGRRLVNLDIGYIAKEHVILATGKPYSHRVYLAAGVFAELTYTYQDKSFHSLPWTYPDYQHPEKVDFFNSIR